MKHGPIALIDEELPVVVLAPARAALRQGRVQPGGGARARRAKVIAVATLGDTKIASQADDVLWIPPTIRCSSRWSACCRCSCSPTTRLSKGTDIDQPRNLAKSVTVE